jgi:hypothetical protein
MSAGDVVAFGWVFAIDSLPPRREKRQCGVHTRIPH